MATLRRTITVLALCAAVSGAAFVLWGSNVSGSSAQGADSTAAVPPLPKHGAQKGDAPAQPINFSHKIHAGDNQIACLYCHVGADKGPVATIPAVQTCMGCHKLVAASKPEIQKLNSYWQNKQPIPWTKVYDVSDHVYFTHKRHVRAGFSCQTCHGPIQEMPVVRLQQRLSMGFCVKCHKQHLNDRNTPASLDCATCHR